MEAAIPRKHRGATETADAIAAKEIARTESAYGVHMNGTRALRVVAFMSISVGVGILSRGAWGFVMFGILVLIDSFVIKSRPPAPPDHADVEREDTAA